MGRRGLIVWLCVAAISGSLARGQTQPSRPDLSAVKPIATCALQTVSLRAEPQYEQAVVGLYATARPAVDALASYERTPLGDWRMPAAAVRDDPWLRILLLSRKRPVVIDMAVFIDGKSFRDSRESWIDEVIAGVKEAQAEHGPGGDSNGLDELGNNNSAPPGTNTSDGASEGDASPDSLKDQGPPRLGGPAVSAQSRRAPTMRDRLMSYLTTNGAEADRDEIGWLLAEWGAGPAVVVLGPGLSWQRAGLDPLLAHLDQDADSILSAEEVRQVEMSLKRADFNGDDVVEIDELRRAAQQPVASAAANGHSLIVQIDAKTDWDSLGEMLGRHYGEPHRAPAAGPRELSTAPADITLRVDFSTQAKEEKRVGGASLVSVRHDLAASGEAVIGANDVLSLDVAGDFVEFAAAQMPTDKYDSASASQIAIGAVIDGNPLLRLVDRGQDSRLTLRERQTLIEVLSGLDRNLDGNMSADEVPTPYRLAVTLGPHVHELLATPVGSVRSISPRDATSAPPDWFASMDKNNDRDLSPDEFLGTPEQFRQFDSDGDGLLSSAEVLKLNNGQ